MNPKIKPIILMLLAFAIFSSCTIQKRRHFRGFNIEFLSGKFINSSFETKVKKNKTAKNIDSTPINNSSNNSNVVVAKLGIVKTQIPIGSTIKNVRLKNKANNMELYKKPSKKTADFTGKNQVLEVKTNTDKTINHLPPQNKQLSKRKLALIIGISLLLMAIVAVLTVPPLTQLFVLNNVTLTGLNVTTNFGKYTASVIGWIVIGFLDLIASWGIYKYYKDKEPKMAKITSGLRLLYTCILGVGIAQLLMVSSLSSAAVIYNSISMFNKFWGIGLIIFGFHLIALGILYKNEGGKKWVNITIKSLLISAGIGYIIQYVGILLVANPVTFAAFVQPIFIVPMIFGEICYAIWKIANGGKKVSK